MNEIHVISLGAGVQSSTMALMAAAGEIKPMPDAAIFADTQAEPQSVYRWLDWLDEQQLPFPIYRVTEGNLEEVTIIKHPRKDGSGWWNRAGIPAFTVNRDGTHGQMDRQCTSDFKVKPVKREIRRLLAERGIKKAILWIGISLDEVHRMKPSRLGYIEHRYPLIDARMTRGGCLIWMAGRGFPRPPRSACVFCPYHSDSEWRRLKEDESEAFERAVEFERVYAAAKIGSGGRKTAEQIFLHTDRIPLDQVDFSTDVDNGQQLLNWGNECEGMCGV